MEIIHDYATLATALHERITTACADIAAGNSWIAALALMHVAVHMALEVAETAGTHEEIARYLAEETPGLIHRVLANLSQPVVPPTDNGFIPVDTV